MARSKPTEWKPDAPAGTYREPAPLYVLRDKDPLWNVLHAAVLAYPDDDDEHTPPTPSGIGRCRLQQWFAGVGAPRTNPIPAASRKKMESGKVIEPFWRNMYEAAGFTVISPLPRLPFDNFTGGQADALIIAEDEGLARSLGVPVGAKGVLELKDLGIFSFTDFVDKGLAEAHPEYMAQVQCYIAEYGADFAVVHAGQADNSAQTFWWRRIRRREGRAPPFWLEVVYPDPALYRRLNARAAEVAWYIENHPYGGPTPVTLRDFDVHKLLEGEKFPCYYCGWAEACALAR